MTAATTTTATRRPRGGRQTAPLAVWAGAGMAAAVAVTWVVAAVGLRLADRLDRTAQLALLPALVLVPGFGALAAMLAHRFARALRALRGDAVRRLQDPGAPVRAPALNHLSARASLEVLELARTLDALHLRVRVADEVAERHRRTAETASAGMFELLSGMVAAEESARGQLSAELHDTVAQSLMLARGLLVSSPGEGQEPAQLARAVDLVSEAEEQVRAVMARTRPPALRDGDLALAVRQLRDDLVTRYGLVVLLEWPETAYPLPLVTAITVYRFFQEALLNVVKHADVDQARARLEVDEHGVTATVSDAGPGFDPERVQPERGRHVGLGLLRERARLAGGSLEVSSWPADGTTLTLRMPRGASTIGPRAERRPA